MRAAKILIRELGRRAPQYVVDQIQAAIRNGGSETELKTLKARLDYVEQLLTNQSGPSAS